MTEEGTNQFGSQFSFMQNMNQMSIEMVPFKHLFMRINDTQKMGWKNNSASLLLISSQKVGGFILKSLR